MSIRTSTNCLSLWSSPSATKFCSHSQRNLLYLQFKMELRTWRDEQQGQPEYDFRVNAEKEFEACFESKSESLNLYGFQLTSIPSAIRFLPFLRSIHLANNEMTSLPVEIYDLENLEILNLKNNRFENLSSGLYQLCNLKTLILDNNPITGLPIDFFLMKGKCTISLEGCPINNTLFQEFHSADHSSEWESV